MPLSNHSQTINSDLALVLMKTQRHQQGIRNLCKQRHLRSLSSSASAT